MCIGSIHFILCSFYPIFQVWMCIGSIQIILCSFYPIFQVLDMYREHSDLSLLILSYFSGVGCV